MFATASASPRPSSSFASGRAWSAAVALWSPVIVGSGMSGMPDTTRRPPRMSVVWIEPTSVVVTSGRPSALRNAMT